MSRFARCTYAVSACFVPSGLGSGGIGCFSLHEQEQNRSLVDRLRQLAASFELDDLFRRNLNGLAGLRVSSLTSIALGDGERTESDESDFVTLVEALGDGGKRSVKGLLSGCLADVGGSGDTFDQFLLVRVFLPDESLKCKSYRATCAAPFPLKMMLISLALQLSKKSRPKEHFGVPQKPHNPLDLGSFDLTWAP